MRCPLPSTKDIFMPGQFTFEALKNQVADGTIDTVLACFVDMQGRLMGKRFHAANFVETSFEETHCCNYLLATDLEMATPDGYASTSWETGYGDYVMKPDLSTIRLLPWLEGTALVLCDILDHHTHEEVAHAPRAMLKKQITRLNAMGLDAKMATELEFFLFEKSFDDIRKDGFQNLEPISGYNEDYHILQTTKEEGVMRPIRNHLYKAGLPWIAPITIPSLNMRSKRSPGKMAARQPFYPNGTRIELAHPAMFINHCGKTGHPRFMTAKARMACQN